MDIDELAGHVRMESFIDLDNKDCPPSLHEIEQALTWLKNHKTPGIDSITNEQRKYGGEAIKERLYNIFARVWNSEAIPDEWSKEIIVVVLLEKGASTVCKNNRGITLRSTASNVFQMVILTRKCIGMEKLLRENQAGFRGNRSCVDQLFSLRI